MISLDAKQQSGFTLIELMLAMSLFIGIMVISTVGFVGMNRTFTRGTIRKQLSEAVQNSTQDMARAAQASPQNATVATCNPSKPGCDSTVNAVCLGATRYLWNKDDGGLYKDFRSCSEAPAPDKQSLMDNRYKVQALEVTPLARSLVRIRGVYSTAEEAALALPNTSDPEYAFKITCKGSAETSLVQTCAVEKFDVVINAVGAKV